MLHSNLFMDDLMFSIVPVLVFIIFIVVFGLIITNSIMGMKQWRRNNASPRLSVKATVVTKRTDVTNHHHHNHDNMHHYSSTSYFITFQVESGDRMEFEVSSTEYGYLVEGDIGILSFQGTRYQSFERETS